MDSLLPEPPSGSDSPSANLTESKHVVLSLRCQPYKSIMQAHFHLLGPCPSSLKARDKFMKSLEKELATRVLEMLQSNGESVKLFKLVRFTSDVEEVDEEWAIKKIHLDLQRRMESLVWQKMDHESSLLSITRDEFDDLKNEIRSTVKTKTKCQKSITSKRKKRKRNRDSEYQKANASDNMFITQSQSPPSESSTVENSSDKSSEFDFSLCDAYSFYDEFRVQPLVESIPDSATQLDLVNTICDQDPLKTKSSLSYPNRLYAELWIKPLKERERVNVGNFITQHNKESISSLYKGVSFHRLNQKYATQLYANHKKYHIGVWLLAADSAYAYDRGASELISDGRKRNFDTIEDYEMARAKELEDRDISMKTAGCVGAVKEKIEQRVMKLRYGNFAI